MLSLNILVYSIKFIHYFFLLSILSRNICSCFEKLVIKLKGAVIPVCGYRNAQQTSYTVLILENTCISFLYLAGNQYAVVYGQVNEKNNDVIQK